MQPSIAFLAPLFSPTLLSKHTVKDELKDFLCNQIGQVWSSSVNK